MPIINVRSTKLDVDIENELRQFEWGYRAKWSSDKLIAPSPFRDESRPSFFVNLSSGGWGDSGAIDSEWEHGNFVTLLSFLRNETEEESEEYLLSMYSADYKYDGLTISPKFHVEKRQYLDEGTLNGYQWRHPYLTNRGISEKVQRVMQVGYDRDRQAIVLPWRDANGRLANVKYRSVNSKIFWYQQGGVPIRDIVYGMDVVYKVKAKKAVICEAEIDALTAMTIGNVAIAVGGSKLSQRQADIIRSSPLEEITIATDNDEQGYKLKRKIIRMLSPYISLRSVELGEYNDMNDVIVANSSALTSVIDKANRYEVEMCRNFTKI